MAKREALRELQARLASRLQAARTEGISVNWLAVRAGGRNFLFPLGQSGEIFPVSHMQTVPYSQSWFPGVHNIRGGLFGVVDFAGFIAQTAGLARTEPVAAEPSVVTLNAALEVNCALQVDSLAGLRGADAFQSSQPPAPTAPEYFGTCYVTASAERWQEIDLRALSQNPAFLTISA